MQPVQLHHHLTSNSFVENLHSEVVSRYLNMEKAVSVLFCLWSVVLIYQGGNLFKKTRISNSQKKDLYLILYKRFAKIAKSSWRLTNLTMLKQTCPFPVSLSKMFATNFNPPSAVPWFNLVSSISFPLLISAFLLANSSAIVNFFGPGPPGPKVGKEDS